MSRRRRKRNLFALPRSRARSKQKINPVALIVVLAVILIGGAGGGAVAAPKVVDATSPAPAPVAMKPICPPSVTAKWNDEQRGNAATIAGEVRKRGLPIRATVIALAVVIQESTLHNYHYGDRDSQGLFQQRPSQGWGSVAEVTNPVYATNKFLDSLTHRGGWDTRKLGQVAQEVQRSYDWTGYTYARHEADATALAACI